MAVKPSRELIERVGAAIRRLGCESVTTRHTIAAAFGIHTTDLESLDVIVARGGTCSPGALSKATGLSSGSTTALIDRLVNAGYVVRESDPDDRRKIIVRIRNEARERCEAAYAPIAAELTTLWSGYSTEQLELIEQFLLRSADLHANALRRLTPTR